MYFMYEAYEKVKSGQWPIIQVVEEMAQRGMNLSYNFYCLNEQEEVICVDIPKDFRDVAAVIRSFAQQEGVSHNDGTSNIGRPSMTQQRSWWNTDTWTHKERLKAYPIKSVRAYNFPSFKLPNFPVHQVKLEDTWIGPLSLSISLSESCPRSRVSLTVEYRAKNKKLAPLLIAIRSSDGKIYKPCSKFKYREAIQEWENKRPVPETREYIYSQLGLLEIYPGDELLLLQSVAWEEAEKDIPWGLTCEFEVVGACRLDTRKKEWVDTTRKGDTLTLEYTHKNWHTPR